MENTLQVPKPPMHSYIIIAVPDEKIEGHVSDIKILKSEKQEYKIIDRVQIMRGHFIPSILGLLSTGQYLTSKDVFTKYNKSNSLYFFICKKNK